MHNTLEVARVVGPWRLRLLAEALDATPGCVLDDHIIREVRDDGIVVSVVDHNRDGSRSCIGQEFVKPLGGRGAWVTKDARVGGYAEKLSPYGVLNSKRRQYARKSKVLLKG